MREGKEPAMRSLQTPGCVQSIELGVRKALGSRLDSGAKRPGERGQLYTWCWSKLDPDLSSQAKINSKCAKKPSCM